MMSIVAAFHDVDEGRHRRRCGKFSGRPLEKMLDEVLTWVGAFEYHNNLYGDADRGCHHRGDGPDASQRTISNNRQRRGVLFIRGPAAKTVGLQNRWNQPGPHHQEKEVTNHGSEEEGR
jgi:hypothetical protein